MRPVNVVISICCAVNLIGGEITRIKLMSPSPVRMGLWITATVVSVSWCLYHGFKWSWKKSK